jgi:hypothetical protein
MDPLAAVRADQSQRPAATVDADRDIEGRRLDDLTVELQRVAIKNPDKAGDLAVRADVADRTALSRWLSGRDDLRWVTLGGVVRGQRTAVVQRAPVPGRGDLPLCVAVLPLPAQLPRGGGADARARCDRLL